MIRQLLALVIGTFTLIPLAVKAEDATPEKAAEPEPYQVYVKVMMPVDPAIGASDQSVVESWIVEELKKRGQKKFVAVTGWVSLGLSPFDATDVWDGGKLDSVLYCPVFADIREREVDHIAIWVIGWSPGGADANVSMKYEPGTRAIAAVDEMKTEQGMPYVAFLIGPPAEKPTSPTDDKK
ncbi:MAG: hypothetical protein KDA69_12755 [Planctomycetaceae bacterium]|nr:hypothetical protein [Planctomycetaceae bacterium]